MITRNLTRIIFNQEKDLFNYSVDEVNTQISRIKLEKEQRLKEELEINVYMRHNKVRDLEAEFVREVCHDVKVEPPLLPSGYWKYDTWQHH